MSDVEHLRRALTRISTLRPAGDAATATNARALVQQMEQIALQALRTPSKEVSGEVERLRDALIRCGRAAGALLADNVSTEFLMLVPAEVEARIASLNTNPDTGLVDSLRSTLEEARLQLEYMDERSPSGTTPAVLARINAALSEASK
jgi:hypothetical protein